MSIQLLPFLLPRKQTHTKHERVITARLGNKQPIHSQILRITQEAPTCLVVQVCSFPLLCLSRISCISCNTTFLIPISLAQLRFRVATWSKSFCPLHFVSRLENGPWSKPQSRQNSGGHAPGTLHLMKKLPRTLYPQCAWAILPSQLQHCWVWSVVRITG